MEVIAQTVPIEEDIGDFSGWLRQQGIAHRISEHGGAQVLRVEHEHQVPLVQSLYQNFRAGELQITKSRVHAKRGDSAGGLRQVLSSSPATLLLIILSICGATLVALDRSFEWVSLLTFSDPAVGGGVLPGRDQLWRILTPLFLHFGALHICFNALWVWELGRRIEHLQGGSRVLLLTVFTGAGSNFAQALVTGGVIFGGMSGVIYGLLGYCVVWSKLRPESGFQINNAVVIFMLAWLVLCYAGFSRLVAGVDTANTAHLSGLILGCIAALLAATFSSRNQRA